MTAPTQLPNGDIELPNGEIVSPTGQVVGNILGPPGRIGVSVINPSDQYTGTATVSKIFNGAVMEWLLGPKGLREHTRHRRQRLLILHDTDVHRARRILAGSDVICLFEWSILYAHQ